MALLQPQPNNNIIPITNGSFKRISLKDNAEWLKERGKGLGGSDASCIVGLNPYKSNVELWEEKTGRKKSPDISHKPEVQYGKKSEHLLRELFILDYPEYEVYHKEFELLVHPKYDFLRASLDGELIEKSTGRKGILEVKTTNILQSMQREKWNDRIPDNYFIQVLHYLLVTGYDFVVLKAQLKTKWEGETRLNTRHYHLERTDFEEDIEFLLEKEINFWELAQKGVKPNLILPRI